MHGKTLALGLGSNLGNPVENLRSALSKIKLIPELRVIKTSSLFESDALMPEGAPAEWNKKYLNAAVLVEASADVNPVSLLQSLKAAETSLGRTMGEPWAPRIIDIDILYWSGGAFKEAALEIPHRGLMERPFALLPLLQIWPELAKELDLPAWAREWNENRPFNTCISKNVWPRLAGILNVTPDSFSGDGILSDEEGLLAQLQKFQNSGIEILDVGAESTRPQAKAVSPEEELKRLQWAFDLIKTSGFKFHISLDCRRGEVVSEILKKYAIDFLNDVTGFDSPSMLQILKDFPGKAFVMHSLGVPPSQELTLATDTDPCAQLNVWWKNKIKSFAEDGIATERLIFDPGIGFGKTPLQNLYILENLDLFDVKNDIMIGHSRKSFQTVFSDRKGSERDLETALITAKLNPAFVQYLRVHDGESQMQALRAGSYL
jgi:2-amino-4-hydroxy-6-hydroxymethyldihydropteridine diphosphokinase/dihydropteroate synthase